MTLLTLERMLQEAYLSSLGPEDEMTRDAWETIMAERSPTFKFWCLIRKYETLILIFVRAHRQRNVTLYMYVEVLKELTPLFFALDHINYARWTPIHIRDMKSLPKSLKEEFEKDKH